MGDIHNSKKPEKSAVDMAIAAVEGNPNPLDTDMNGIDPDPTSLDLNGSQNAEMCSNPLHSLDPVAIRLEQRTVKALGRADRGHVTCQSCGDRAAEAKYLAMFERILADEHKQGQSRQDTYKLGS